MGVPTSEVGYTIATTRGEKAKVHKNMWWHWGTILLNITLSSTPWSSNWSLPLSIQPTRFLSNITDVTLSIRQTSSISISNVTSGQITKLITMQVTPTVSYFHPLASKYSPQHPLLKSPQCTLRVKNRVTKTNKTQILGYAIKMFHKQ